FVFFFFFQKKKEGRKNGSARPTPPRQSRQPCIPRPRIARTTKQGNAIFGGAAPCTPSDASPPSNTAPNELTNTPTPGNRDKIPLFRHHASVRGNLSRRGLSVHLCLARYSASSRSSFSRLATTRRFRPSISSGVGLRGSGWVTRLGVPGT